MVLSRLLQRSDGHPERPCTAGTQRARGEIIEGAVDAEVFKNEILTAGKAERKAADCVLWAWAVVFLIYANKEPKSALARGLGTVAITSGTCIKISPEFVKDAD